MIAYPDTSFLCSLYRGQEHSPNADRYRLSMDEPLYFTGLLEFEFIQAVRLQVWLHKNDRTKGYSQDEAERMLTDWETDIASGVNRLIANDADAVLRLARMYSLRHTSAGGHRTLDVLHVATAVHLGARDFLTFDTRQRSLAEQVQLNVPF